LEDNPRSRFDQIEYAHLIKTINEMIEAGVRGARFGLVTKELLLLTTFLVNSYLRPGDIYLLRHKDVSLHMKNDKRFLKIYAQSKVAPSFVFCNETVITTYSAITRFNAGSADGEDYVFLPKYKNRDYAKSLIAKQFNEALTRAELKVGQIGANRTLYSLRHTCIMNRMTNGVPYSLPDLAAHARTSPGMISRFYGSHLTAEMNAEQFNAEAVNEPEQLGSTLEPFFE
jgi:integrase